MEQDVGGAELGVVVVAVLADAVGDGAGLGEVGSGGGAVAFAAADQCVDQVHGPVEGEHSGGAACPRRRGGGLEARW